MRKEYNSIGLLETHTRLSLSMTLIIVLGRFDSTTMSVGWRDTLTIIVLNSERSSLSPAQFHLYHSWYEE